jgi:hypothetical protein
MDYNNYTKKENESQCQYIIRLVELKNSGADIDYVELFKLAFDVDLSSTEARKRYYGLKMLLPYLEQDKVENITGDGVLKELEIKKQELKKERIKIQTENLDLNRRLREVARMELFEEKVLEALEKRNKQLEIPKLITKYNNENEMVLSIADQHYGAEFEIKGMFDEVINKYSPEIFEKRMWEALNRLVIYSEKNNFKKVHIIDLDDSIEGILHLSQISSLRYGVIDSIIGYADFMETWLNEATKYLMIDFSRVKGNHNDLRLLTGKKGDFPHENTSRLVTYILEKTLKNNPNIIIQGHNSIGCVYKKIAGFDVLASHGQDEKGNLEQSFKDYMITYKINIDYFYTGHLHSTMIKEIGVNKEFIQSPSIMGSNDFSLGIKKTANVGAKITVLSRGLGRTDEHNIILK